MGILERIFWDSRWCYGVDSTVTDCMSLLNGALKLFNGELSQDGTENAVLRKIFRITKQGVIP